MLTSAPKAPVASPDQYFASYKTCYKRLIAASITALAVIYFLLICLIELPLGAVVSNPFECSGQMSHTNSFASFRFDLFI